MHRESEEYTQVVREDERPASVHQPCLRTQVGRRESIRPSRCSKASIPKERRKEKPERKKQKPGKKQACT
jgi:hypothetical protein